MRSTGRPRVVQVLRQPFAHQHSIERVFAGVRDELAADPHRPYDVCAFRSSYPSKGLVPRARAVLEARRAQGDVTHVTGDVHYLTVGMRRATTVLTVHDTEFLSRASAPKRAIYSVLWLRLPVRRCAVVTVPSAATASDLTAALGPRAGRRVDVRVVPNYLRPEFTHAPRPFDERRPTVLLMGTWPTKNLDRSLAALSGLRVRAVVVGPLDTAARARLDAYAVDITHHDDLPDEEVVAVYRDCDLLLFPSLKEGFGLPVLEAQATGRPVVTSTTGPLPEVAGAGACLVDPYDVTAIRSAVERVCSDRPYREQLVTAGLRNVRRFSLETVTAAYDGIYRELLGGRAAGGQPASAR